MLSTPPENEGVAIGEIGSDIPQQFVERMSELEEQIPSCQMDPPATR